LLLTFHYSLHRVDGVPTLGWPDTISFLILPVALVISQFASMELMKPKTDDPAQAQSNAILKFLPLMIGWFSLNVPAALGIYWVVNNVVTTGTSVLIRQSVAAAAEAAGPVTTASKPVDTSPAANAIFSPPREKPSGFGASTGTPSVGGVKPITAIDAEIEKEDLVYDADEDAVTTEAAPKKKRGKKGKKGKN
jgi:YidC/Oxa1 family membrane protein insertase